MQCLGTDRLRPAEQGGVVWHALEIDPRKPAQHQTIGDPLLGFLETPAVEVFDHEQPRQHLLWGGMAPMDGRQAIPVHQIGAHLRIQLIVIKQAI